MSLNLEDLVNLKQVSRNILANFLGKLWNLLSLYLFVGVYIHILGLPSYALINFYSVILGLLVFANSGLAISINREMSSGSDLSYKASLLYTYQIVYLIFGLSIVVLVILSSSSLSNFFLSSDQYTNEEVSKYLKLISIGVFFQLFSTLYEGGLLGLQKQVYVNSILVLWGVVRTAIVIIPLYFYPSIELYFYWQVFSNILFFFIFKFSLWKHIDNGEKRAFSFTILRENSKFLFGTISIALISSINVQVDKLLTSHLLDLESFGHYSLASTMSQLPLLISTPIILAVFPIFSSLNLEDSKLKLLDYFHRYSFIITSISFPIVIIIYMYSLELMELWTGSNQIAFEVSYVVKIMVLGGFFVSLQLVPYYLAISRGHTITSIYLGLIVLFVEIPLMYISIIKFGIIGATIPWVALNFFALLVMSVILIRKFLGQMDYWIWLFFDVLSPMFITIGVALVLSFIPDFLFFDYFFLLKSFLIFVISVLINYLFFSGKLGRVNLIFERSE